MTEKEKWLNEIAKTTIDSEKTFYKIKQYIYSLELAINNEYAQFVRDCPHEEFEWVSGPTAEDDRGYYCCRCGLGADKYRGPRPLKIKE